MTQLTTIEQAHEGGLGGLGEYDIRSGWQKGGSGTFSRIRRNEKEIFNKVDTMLENSQSYHSSERLRWKQRLYCIY